MQKYLLLMASAFLAACATVPRDAGLSEVQQAVSSARRSRRSLDGWTTSACGRCCRTS